MSWQAYVDSNLLGTGKVEKAAIFGIDGSLWATSKGFNVGAVEIQKLIAAFNDTNEIAANGLYLEGKKYFYLRSGENSIYARLGAAGVTCVKTTQAILVGHYAETMQAGDCTVVVESLGDYLRGTGYVKAWEARGKLPHAIDSTAAFMQVVVRDWTQTCSDQDLRMMYSMVFIRFVNGYVDAFQSSKSAKSIAYLAVEKVGMPIWFVELRHTATHDYLPSLTILRSATNQALAWINDNYWIPQLVSVKLDETLTPDMKLAMSEDVRHMLDNHRSEKERQIEDNSLPQPKQEALVVNRLTRDLIKRCRSGDELLDTVIPILLEPGMLVPRSKKTRASVRDLTLNNLGRMVDLCWMPLLNRLHMDLRGTSSKIDGEPLSFWASLLDGMLERLIEANKSAAQTTAGADKSAAKAGSYLITIPSSSPSFASSSVVPPTSSSSPSIPATSSRISIAAMASQIVAENVTSNQPSSMLDSDDIINVVEDCLLNSQTHVSPLIRSVLNTVIECDADIKEKIGPILKQIDQRIVAGTTSSTAVSPSAVTAATATVSMSTPEAVSVGPGVWQEGPRYDPPPQSGTDIVSEDGASEDTEMIDGNEAESKNQQADHPQADGSVLRENADVWTLFSADDWRPCPMGCLPGGILPDLSLPWELDTPPIARIPV
ncbi:profilin, required for normal timing of actin polymerization in response to thermal stress [Mortierella sp. GBA30]|nr:profilin, required for normal timing of actin polymerization in response to thermal stress [Mortierella sp. GBA30]